MKLDTLTVLLTLKECSLEGISATTASNDSTILNDTPVTLPVRPYLPISCKNTNPLTCRKCQTVCRSLVCFERNRQPRRAGKFEHQPSCNTNWTCHICRKVVDVTKQDKTFMFAVSGSVMYVKNISYLTICTTSDL